MSIPYSPFIIKNGFVFTAGQIHLKDGELLNGSITEQTHQVMKNLEKVLSDAGVTFSDVVKTTIYMTDMEYYGEINEVYATYFKDGFPAREAVAVKALPLGAKIEISMVAAKT